ncbi:hypothetical protein, partial [Enterococcus cecorum]
FYLLLLFLNQNDNQEIANNIDKFNQSEIVFKSDNNIQDIAEIKENIEKVKEKEEIVSENKENQTISK